jgi:hypothetical protein
MGLSIWCLEGDPGLVAVAEAMVVDIGLEVDTTGYKKECIGSRRRIRMWTAGANKKVRVCDFLDR